MFWGVGGYVCQLIFLYDLSQELSNLCHCVQHPWKLTTRDFWSSRNLRKPLSKLKHVLRKCRGVSQKNMVYCKMDVFVKTIYYKAMTIENEHFPIYIPGNPINVCWHPQNRACFSQKINLRGHMPRFTLKTSSGCSSMQSIYAWLTGGFMCLLYICIVLDLAVGIVVCKASMLDWRGFHLPSIYMHCTSSSSGYSGMQSSMLDWRGSICLLYICIVRYLAVGVAVCRADVLNWLGGPSACYIYALY